MTHYLTLTTDDPNIALSLLDTVITKYPVEIRILSIATDNGDGTGPDLDLTGDDYNTDLDDISGVSDLVRGRTPRRARDVTCPRCGAGPGDFCKPPTGSSNYGTTFTHAARKLAAAAQQ